MQTADNVVMITGRVPKFKNNNALNYLEAKDENHQAFVNGVLSVNTSYIKKDSKYPESVLIPFKVWGSGAKFLHENIQPGDMISILGEWRRDNDWEDKDGNQRQGQPYVYAISVQGRRTAGNASTSEDGGNDEAAASGGSVKNPLAAHAPKKSAGNPLMRRNRHTVI